MIDLHTHTNNSDGEFSTIELLKIAEERGIKLLSITDHDSVNAYEDIKNMNIKDFYTGKLIIGTEINCVFDNTKIEFLIYGYDLDSVKKWFDDLYKNDAKKKNMLREFNELINICKNKGIKISEDLSYNPDISFPIDTIYYDLIKYEENKKLFNSEVWNSYSLFYRKCTTDKNFILFRDFTNDYPSAEEVSKAMHKRGGKVFLAHLFGYSLDNHEEFLNKLYKANIVDGLECYHSLFNKNQIKFLENFCIKNNMLISGGSDYHGKKYKGIEIGTGYGNLLVNKEHISKWYKI